MSGHGPDTPGSIYPQDYGNEPGIVNLLSVTCLNATRRTVP